MAIFEMAPPERDTAPAHPPADNCFQELRQSRYRLARPHNARRDIGSNAGALLVLKMSEDVPDTEKLRLLQVVRDRAATSPGDSGHVFSWASCRYGMRGSRRTRIRSGSITATLVVADQQSGLEEQYGHLRFWGARGGPCALAWLSRAR
jgi:hypothetical protein